MNKDHDRTLAEIEKRQKARDEARRDREIFEQFSTLDPETAYRRFQEHLEIKKEEAFKEAYINFKHQPQSQQKKPSLPPQQKQKKERFTKEFKEKLEIIANEMSQEKRKALMESIKREDPHTVKLMFELADKSHIYSSLSDLKYKLEPHIASLMDNSGEDQPEQEQEDMPTHIDERTGRGMLNMKQKDKKSGLLSDKTNEIYEEMQKGANLGRKGIFDALGQFDKKTISNLPPVQAPIMDN